MIDYFAIINKYYHPGTRTYKIYVVHATLVTNKALKIARQLELTPEQLEFIEEAGMLHDLGVCQVDSPKMDCSGELPYIAHGVAGAQLLQQEGLVKHAQVAANHVGVGLTRQEIETRGLPLPPQDFVPQTLEEEIITYADLFFSKREATLWQEDSSATVRAELLGYGEQQAKVFDEWQQRFGTA